jgi:methyl-accepting chemotaxis protein
MANRKRRNYFINRRLQGRLILGYFLFVASACLLFIALLTLFTTSPEITHVKNGPAPLLSISHVFNSLIGYWPFLAGGTITLLLTAILVTHRIAGPFFRFEQTILNMQNGILDDKINLRPKDEGQELARQINRFNEDLAKNLRTVSNHSKGVLRLIENLREQTGVMSGEEKQQLSSLLWSLEEKNKKIQSVCSLYELKKR